MYVNSEEPVGIQVVVKNLNRWPYISLSRISFRRSSHPTLRKNVLHMAQSAAIYSFLPITNECSRAHRMVLEWESQFRFVACLNQVFTLRKICRVEILTSDRLRVYKMIVGLNTMASLCVQVHHPQSQRWSCRRDKTKFQFAMNRSQRSHRKLRLQS